MEESSKRCLKCDEARSSGNIAALVLVSRHTTKELAEPKATTKRYRRAIHKKRADAVTQPGSSG